MTTSEIQGETVTLFAAARESDGDPGSLAVYGEWTTIQGIAANRAVVANRVMPIDPPGKPWEVWARTNTYGPAARADS